VKTVISAHTAITSLEGKWSIRK